MNALSLESIKNRNASIYLLAIPLVLSAFTHLWNPIGFPSIYVDEDHYLRRAIKLLENLGYQEEKAPYNQNHPYDHPYFGWIFLASLLKLVGYPDSLNPIPGDVQSIEMLYLVPRLMMGLLAVVDTFLIYKIADYRYSNRNIAFIASLLFAVMPSTWLVRRVMLESILLPFLLASILFAVYYSKRNKEGHKINRSNKINGNSIAIVLLSGIFLGLAIFTKIPAFTMIPLVGYLIFTSTTTKNKKRLRTLGIWFAPVILIPLLWPAYAMFHGQFNSWIDGIEWQTDRNPESPADSVKSLLEIDPILVILGTIGIAIALIQRDLFLILWVAPIMLFFIFIGYSHYIHLAPIIPLFCITTAKLIVALSDKGRTAVAERIGGEEAGGQKAITSYFYEDGFSRTDAQISTPRENSLSRYKGVYSNRTFIVVAIISTFGFISTLMLIVTDVNSSYFEVYSSIVKYLPTNTNNADSSNQITLVGPRPWGIHYFWVPKYVFNKDLAFQEDKYAADVRTEDIITIVKILDEDSAGAKGTSIAKFVGTNKNYPGYRYPYSSMKYNEESGFDVRANY